MEVLERYRSIVDDFAAFRDACARPLDTTVRTNTIKADVSRARAVLEEEGLEPEPLPWQPPVFRVATDSPGATWSSVHGFTHAQEAVSALPVPVLGPEPGERVLDLCAAPGGKTTQLAAAMDDRGTVLANDSNLGRLSALRFNAERLGVTSAVVTNRDGRHYALDAIDADRVDRTLVDVPCSCEGTVRKNPTVLEDWSIGHVRSIAGVQRDLLRRAVQVTRPGGTVVYSTCTFAPEENEGVLSTVLEEADCSLVEPSLPAPLEWRAGVTAWEGETYHPSVSRARRLYPHHNDTGGFFVAALEVAA